MGNEKAKKRNRKNENSLLPFVYSLFFIFNFLFLISHFSFIEASDPKKELEDVQKKLLQQKRKIKQTIKREKSILDELEQINKNLAEKRMELKSYSNKIAETGFRIGKIEDEISLLDEKIKSRKEILRERLRSLYKQQREDIASVLISAADYIDLSKRIKYISFLADYDTKLINTYSNDLDALNLKRRHLEILQQDLQKNKTDAKKKAKDMEAEQEKKDAMLASIRKERETYRDMIKELEDASERLLNMIKELETKESPLSITGKGFGILKGRLPWPIKGNIVMPFGRYTDPKFNIPTFRKGIEIRADSGDPVLAVAEGRVVYADWFKGYGLLLIVNHGDGYHTLYAHLAEIFHKTGDIIKERQAVGKIGESGILNEPSLYFEVRYKGKPLNPNEWLSRK